MIQCSSSFLSSAESLTNASLLGNVSLQFGKIRSVGISLPPVHRRTDSRALCRGFFYGRMRRSTFGCAVPMGGKANSVSSGHQVISLSGGRFKTNHRRPLMSANDTAYLIENLETLEDVFEHLQGVTSMLSIITHEHEFTGRLGDAERAFYTCLYFAKRLIAEGQDTCNKINKIRRVI